jgi:hypothetical protein
MTIILFEYESMNNKFILRWIFFSFTDIWDTFAKKHFYQIIMHTVTEFLTMFYDKYIAYQNVYKIGIGWSFPNSCSNLINMARYMIFVLINLYDVHYVISKTKPNYYTFWFYF